MLAGIGMIILGIIMMILVAIWGVLYIPCGMVFGLITSTQWAKDLFADAGFKVGELYLWFAAGMVVLYVLSRVSEEYAGVFGALVIASLFILTGLLAFPGPAAFISAHIVPLLQAIYMRIGAFLFLFLAIALFPLTIIFTWLFSFWGWL